LTAALILGSDTGVRGQSAGGAVESAVDRFARVAVDLPSRSFEGVLPFDVPFSLTGIAPEGTVGVSVQFAEIPSSGFPSSPLWTPTVPALWKPLDPSVRDQPFRVFFSKTLDARRRYRFRFTVQRQRPEDSTEFVADGETPRNIYVSADAGLLYGIDIETAALYIGSNVYFRPVNKRAPLGVKGSFLRRAAMTVGFTVTSIADDDNRTRSDMFGHQSLVLGGGLRLTQSLRAGAGALVFRERDRNPLISRTSVATSPYVSLSFDLNVGAMFERMGW
jgi:hypothetical protein